MSVTDRQTDRRTFWQQIWHFTTMHGQKPTLKPVAGSIQAYYELLANYQEVKQYMHATYCTVLSHVQSLPWKHSGDHPLTYINLEFFVLSSRTEFSCCLPFNLVLKNDLIRFRFHLFNNKNYGCRLINQLGLILKNSLKNCIPKN